MDYYAFRSYIGYENQHQPPVVQPQPKKNNKNKISVNLSETQYEIVERICQELEWKLQFNSSKNWDVKWSDNAITGEFLSKMEPYQKINHFPGMNTLHRKNNLAKNLFRMQSESPQEYSFFPRTFLLPFDFNLLKTYYTETRRKGILKTFIVKPQANCQGRGIFLTQDIDQIIKYQHCIVQKYVSNPLLYKGLKFDLRIYVLLAGCDPLRIYIYNEGLVRFATEKYEPPCEENIDNLYMHLTNYAINKDNPKYVFNDSLQNLSYGHKKSLAQFFQTLKSMGLKAHQYWSDIKDTIVKTLISGQPHLQHEYRTAQPNNLQNNMCFEVLGFDFMFDSNDNCYLLEVNHTPSFSADTPLDELIKSNLIYDTLMLMNITTKSKTQIVSNMKQIQKKRVLTGKMTKLLGAEREKKLLQIKLQRDEYESNNLGSFQCIFPSKSSRKQQKYISLLDISLSTYKLTTTNPRKTTGNFRIKRIITNQSRFEENQSLEMQCNESRPETKEKSKTLGKNTRQETLLSQKSQLKTTKQLATMFSRKMNGSPEMKKKYY